MNDVTVVSLQNFHMAKSDATSGNDEGLHTGPLKVHPFLDPTQLQHSVNNLPSDVRIGREIYLETYPPFQEAPWGLIVSVEVATSEKKGRRIVMSYEPVIGVLLRRGYGDFLAGDITSDTTISHFRLSDLMATWPHDVEGDSCRRHMTQAAHMMTYTKRVRRVLPELNNSLGQPFTVPDRGDVPAILTGATLSVPRDDYPAKPDLLGMYQVEGFDIPACFPYLDMQPVRLSGPCKDARKNTLIA